MAKQLICPDQERISILKLTLQVMSSHSNPSNVVQNENGDFNEVHTLSFFLMIHVQRC